MRTETLQTFTARIYMSGPIEVAKQIIRVQLSDKANAVCEANYHGWEKKVNGCHRCPIRNECGAGCQHSWEGLNEYTEKINAAAEKVVL